MDIKDADYIRRAELTGDPWGRDSDGYDDYDSSDDDYDFYMDTLAAEEASEV
jgi:hypothetical protein